MGSVEIVGRNGNTVQVVTLLLSLVAALAGLWNGWQIAKLTGQVATLQEILIAHMTTPGVPSGRLSEPPAGWWPSGGYRP